MNFIYIIFVFLFLNTSNSLPLSTIEMESITWLSIQYSTGWNTRSTDCNSINVIGLKSYIVCQIDEENPEFETINEIFISPENDSTSAPDPNLKMLRFKSLKSFSIKNNQRIGNSSANIFELLDNLENKFIETFRIIDISRIDIPSFFPKYLPLQVLEIESIIVENDIPESIFYPPRNLVFLRPIFGNNSNIILNESGNYSTLTSLDVRDWPIPRNKDNQFNISFKADSFPNLTTIYFSNVVSNMTAIISLPSLTNIISSGVNLFFIDAPKIIELNLSILPNLKRIIAMGPNIFISDARNLTKLDLSMTNQPLFPPASWFSQTENIDLSFSKTNTYGKIPSSYQYLNFSSFNFINNMLYIHPLENFMCKIKEISFLATGVRLVPNCFYCYWYFFSTFFPKDAEPQANFKCNVTLQNIYVKQPNSSNNQITIKGNNLGYQVDSLPSNMTALVYNSEFLLPAEGDFGQQFVQFSIKNKYNSTIYWVIDSTRIDKVDASINGLKLSVGLYGQFNNSLYYNIRINSYQECIITSFTPNLINCTITLFNYITNNIFVELTNNYHTITAEGDFRYAYPLVTATSTLTTDGGLLTLNGFFGLSNNSLATVSIGTYSCIIQSFGFFEIQCNIAGPLAVGTKNLTVWVDTYVFRSNIVISPSQQRFCRDPKRPSSVDCNGNGYCNSNGMCMCLPEYSGFYCELKSTNGTIITNSSTPTASFNVSGYQFNFDMVAIQEVDSLGNVIKEVLTNKWLLNITINETSGIHSYSYELNYTRNLLRVITILEYSNNSRVVEFGGYSTMLPAYSIKLTSIINGWDYESTLNTLRVLFTSKKGESKGSCSNRNDDIGKNPSDNSIQYLKVFKDDIIFYGSFMPVVLSNGRPTFSKNEILNETDTFYWFSINLPQCVECVIDPNFSVLIADSGDNCGDKNKWKIITIATVCSIVGVALLVIGAIIINKRRRYITEDKKLQSKMYPINRSQQKDSLLN